MADSKNPSGALPDDPRHGLSEDELRTYYRTKSPTWIMRGMLKAEGGIEARAAAMDPHLAYLRASRDQIRFAGPLFADDDETPRGSMTLLDAPDREAAASWLADEPYNKAGAFDETTFTRWSSSMDIRQLDYPRTPGWRQFVITAFDAPDGQAKRRQVAEAHHEFQASVMDRYVARGPMFDDDGTTMIGSLMIVELPDAAACEAFWADEPLNTGGVFERATIERWRYGKAIG